MRETFKSNEDEIEIEVELEIDEMHKDFPWLFLCF